MTAAGLGIFSAKSLPYWRSTRPAASSSRKRRSPQFWARHPSFSRSSSTSSLWLKAPSLSTASAGEKRPSSLTARSSRPGPEKAVAWVRPVVTSQKQSPAHSPSI